MSETTETKLTKGGYTGRYSVTCDGHYVGWVARNDMNRKWGAYVIAHLADFPPPAGTGYCVMTDARTRREAVQEIEIYFQSRKWRLDS